VPPDGDEASPPARPLPAELVERRPVDELDRSTSLGVPDADRNVQ
jgi:hypothetical protein